MAISKSIAVCCPQVPFVTGGAELLVDSLCEQLRLRGHSVDKVSIPLRWTPKSVLLDQYLMWRLTDLRDSNGREIDQVIATKFPSFAVNHPNKVTWLTHQFRQVYDLFDTPLSDYGRTPDDLEVKEMIRRIDCRTLAESKRIFTISKNVSKRLKQYNKLDSEALYHPPPFHDLFRRGEPGDYILSVGRLDRAKRVDLLISAMAHTDGGLRCVIAGEGPEGPELRRQAEELGLSDRIQFVDRVGIEQLAALYAESLAVYFAPVDEDYGYVTLEAFLSGKPVVTAHDAGGPVEFVRDGESGVIVEPEPQKIGDALRSLAADPGRAAAMGAAGYEVARKIEWEGAIDRLVLT